MAAISERKCPNCTKMMHNIRIIDKAHGSAHADLEYTLPEAKRSFWFGKYPVEGIVLAYMCDHCGRIALYGAPYEQE